MPPPTLEQAIWAFLVDDVALDLCFEMHREVKTSDKSLEELYDVQPFEQLDRPATSQQQSLFVGCAKCKRQVHASRYAPHLEKCIAGSRRQSTMEPHDYEQ